MRIFFPRLTAALVLAAAAPGSPAMSADPCNTPSGNQGEMNKCYADAFEASDAALNGVYKGIQKRLKNSPATLKQLVSAQRAWLAFRDAECAFSASGVQGGSAHPMVVALCLDGLTSKRIEELKYYLKCQEGDLSCPTWTN